MVYGIHRITRGHEPCRNVTVAAGVLTEPVRQRDDGFRGRVGHPRLRMEIESADAGSGEFALLHRDVPVGLILL
jgi:hypothetical protein